MITIVEFKAKQATGSVDALRVQPIKVIQVASTSELCENQRNNLLSFEIVPCYFCRASEVQYIRYIVTTE